jgi:hypothetical protein
LVGVGAEFHTKRIEMAKRNLLSAARTLAKMKSSKLPDVLAMVNVNPPTVGPA